VSTAGDPAAVAGPLRSALRSIEPNVVLVAERTLGDIASESLRVTKLVLWLLSVFAGLALVLAAVGVAGLELFGPRLFLVRRLFVLVIALTVVGLVAVAVAWWVLHRRGADGGGEDGEDAPVPPPAPDTSDVFVPVDEAAAPAGA